MKYLVSGSEMRAWDKNTIEQFQVPSMVLMERAALKVVETMEEHKFDMHRVLVLCGSGNNGGDGLAIARLFFLQGRQVDIFFLGNREKATEETSRQMEIVERYGMKIGTTLPEKTYTVIVDALFGIGLSRKVEGRYGDILDKMNHMRKKGAKVVAVDMPSGIHSDTGEVMGTALGADLTVTFASLKLGQILYPGCQYCGRLVAADIGISKESLKEKPFGFLYETEDLKRLPMRLPSGNKGTFGKVLVIAGSRDISGAAYLCACAALRSGAGMVRIYTREENRAALASLLPEALITTYGEGEEAFDDLGECLSWADVIAVGSGIGQSRQSEELLLKVFSENGAVGKNKRPCVLDADALNLLAKMPDKQPFPFPAVITPHLGEMARLTGKSISEIQKSLIETAKEYAKETKAVCVMKDARTIVAWGTEEFYVNVSGNSGMATAGSGDVLAGVIAALIGQGMAMQDAAVMGVYLHGLGGDQAAEGLGEAFMTARDIIDGIGQVRKAYEKV